MKIKKLSENLIKQIAAGEVISHPANALKEIIENSIDAGSSHITIHINKNGLEKITLIDDGCGMDLEDLKICTQIHTTSKTAENEHMFGMHTLGFRGEALASIDAISDLTIETNGYKFEKNQLTKSNITEGTKIEINNMFAQLPARLKFLKSSNVEWQNIKNTLQKYIINCENITWTIFNNGKKFWHFDKVSNAEFSDHKSGKENRIKEVFKDDFVFSSHTLQEVQMSAYLFKNHSNSSSVFVNNRPIKDRAIHAYIKSIFREFFMKNENPSYVLFINIDPILIDCNVHPAKDEIKFISYSNIFAVLSYIFAPSLLNELYKSSHLIFANHDSNFSNKTSRGEISQNEILQNQASAIDGNQEYKAQSYETQNLQLNYSLDDSLDDSFNYKSEDAFHYSAQKNTENINYVNEPSAMSYGINYEVNYPENDEANACEYIANSNSAKEKSIFETQQFKIIGQVKNSFVIFEIEDGIGIFDQHAAHERQVYERMKKELNRENTQQLLLPQELNLPAEKKEYIAKNLEKFANKGIIIAFGDQEILHITHIPNALANENFAQFLENTIDENVDCDIAIDRLLADIACKNALKANTPLSIDQMQTLLLAALQHVPVCNHGRPIFKYFKHSEIGAWFKR